MCTLQEHFANNSCRVFFSFHGMNSGNVAPKGSFVITGQLEVQQQYTVHVVFGFDSCSAITCFHFLHSSTGDQNLEVSSCSSNQMTRESERGLSKVINKANIHIWN